MPDSTTMFSLLLDRWRTVEEGRSDADFARLLQISPSMVSRARAAKVRLDSTTLAAACVAMGANREEATAVYVEVGHALPPVLTSPDIHAEGL